MRFGLVQQGIQHALTYLNAIVQVNNVDIDIPQRRVSWKGRSPGIQRNVYYPMEYQFLLDRQQFSLLLTDGSFLQFFYEFNVDDQLTAAKLAFYPRPMKTSDMAEDLIDAAEAAVDREDEELYEHLCNWVELMEVEGNAPVNTSHFRFDYDPNATSHEKSHLQYGAVQDLRLAADFFPQPIAFLELCQPLLAGLGTVTTAHAGFARNNRLSLARTQRIICLGS